jgi:hypothetical protein
MNITDICNMALSQVAQETIANVDEQSESARQCRMYYDITRKNLLSTFRWGFAERNVKLALVDTAIPKWDYAYGYPSECLMIHQIYNKERGPADEAYKDDHYNEYELLTVNDTQKIIGTDIELAWASYTADVKNAEAFSSFFCEALAHNLAYKLAIPLAGSQSLMQQEHQFYQAAISQAMTASAIETHHKPDYPTHYFDCRR